MRLAIYGAFVLGSAGLVLRAVVDVPMVDPMQRAAFGLAFGLAALVLFLSFAPGCRCMRSSRGMLVLGGSLLHVLICGTLVRWVGELTAGGLTTPVLQFLVVPYAFAPMLLGVLLGRTIGLFAALYVSLTGCLMMEPENLLGFLGLSLMSGVTAVMLSDRLRKRGELLSAGIYAGMVALFMAMIWGILDLGSCFGTGAMLHAETFGLGVSAVLGTAMVTALLISGLLPVFEGTFGITTNITWLELSDLNHKLLRRMQLEAPGTFHHSLVVATLSEAAAERVGANALVCRVCSYFHDIGKLDKPEYFIENQHDGEENPHNTLTPTMSALVIIAHVKDGVDLAVKHKLNPRIINVIQEHHGDTLVYYFYRRAQEQKKIELGKAERGSENPDELPHIDEKNYRYPGPRPSTLESGIISLADSVESVSRTLRKPTLAKIRAMVDELVLSKISSGLLDDCPMTLGELADIKESFTASLRGMLHARIDYPKDDDRGSGGARRAEPHRASPLKPDTATRSLPVSREAPKSQPSPDKAPKSQPNPDKAAESPPTPDEAAKSPPNPDETAKSPPTPDEAAKGQPHPDEEAEDPPPPREADKGT